MIRFGARGPAARSPGLISLFLCLAVTLSMFAWFHSRGEGENGRELPQPAALAKDQPPMMEETNMSVDVEQLREFKDHSRNLANGPYYYLLDLAKHSSMKELEKKAIATVAYVELLNDPERFRGKALRLKGRVRRSLEFAATRNPYGFEKQYENWLFTKESGSHPYVIVCAEPTPGFEGSDLNEPAEAIGFFLGWWRYDAGNGNPNSAPVILAKRMEPTESPVIRPDLKAAKAHGKEVGAVVASLLIAGFFWLRRKLSIKRQITHEEPDSLPWVAEESSLA